MAIAVDQRPDPDQLLEQLREQEQRAQRGRLRIYFGASAGVGKTFAMLGAAQRELAGGRDVVVGLVETHGRADTEQLLQGLPLLPRRALAYRDRTIPEFDIDAALARKPQVVLVDELAHSNVPGSRHPKRWQDVQELLDAGIDVWSTLNVQHLESLNGTVGAITGIRVNETVPDTVLDHADEVVLVDVTPDELLQRLKAGKVYLPQQAERAAQNFFRKGNLIALREMALRRTAEHVEEDVRGWRIEQSKGLPAWNTSGAILACVGPDPDADQTVRTAARLASLMNVRWHAAYVETSRLRRLPESARDRVLAVLKLAEELGAATSVLAGEDAGAALVAHAQELNCALLVVGRPQERLRWWPGTTMTRRLGRLVPGMDVVEVGRTRSVRRLAPLVSRAEEEETAAPWQERFPGYAWAAASCIAITLAATPLIGHLELTNIVMLYLLGMVAIAFRFGRGPAALSALMGVAAFDFFFVPPRFTFAVSDAQYLVTFSVMLLVGLLIGQLTAGLRFQAQVSTSRERRAQLLFELTRELSGALLAQQVVELGEAAVQRHFGGRAIVMTSDAQDRLVLPAHTPEGFDASVADWCFNNGQPAGYATSTLAAQAWQYVPLQAPMRVRGVLALQPAQPRWLLVPEQKQQLDTLARQVAIALERVHYVEIAQQALVEMESERLRNALLAAISHDVRTPLTALLGLAEQLRASRPPLAREQADLAQTLVDQGRELNTMVGNLLDMARLQSGAVNLRLEWGSVEEVVGSSLRAIGQLLPPASVRVQIPPDLPLVEFDAALIERVLVNLLENTAKYGAPPVEVGAQVTDDAVVITVRDHGPGLPASVKGREPTLFEKFTRGQSESSTRGVGLGLAICKAVVDAHKGSIHASDAPTGGAQFTVRLPRRPPPLAPA
jgi:two-component system, OmpR family, sensor histidine kinase KdpD